MFNWKSRIAVVLVSGLGVGMFYNNLMPVYQAQEEEVYAYIQEESIEPVPSLDVLDGGGLQYTETEEPIARKKSVTTDYGTSSRATEEDLERILESRRSSPTVGGDISTPVEEVLQEEPTVVYVYKDAPKDDISTFNYVHGIIGSILGWLLTFCLDGVKSVLTRKKA